MSTTRSRRLLGAIAFAPCLAAAGCASGRAAEPPPPAPASSSELRAANEKIAKLEDDVAQLRRRVDGHDKSLGTGISETDAAHAPPPSERPPVSGSILTADPVNDSYLLSRGKQDGVYPGDQYTVMRGETFVAVVVVDKVFADKSTATVKLLGGKPHKKSDIRQGDRFSSVE